MGSLSQCVNRFGDVRGGPAPTVTEGDTVSMPVRWNSLRHNAFGIYRTNHPLSFHTGLEDQETLATADTWARE
jgi:hypothetical protein